MQKEFMALKEKSPHPLITDRARPKLKLARKEKISAGQKLAFLMMIFFLGSGLRPALPSLTENFWASLTESYLRPIFEKNVVTRISPDQASAGIKIFASSPGQVEQQDEIINRKEITVALIDFRSGWSFDYG